MVRIVTVFVASPGDVATERTHVADVAAALNRNTADERNVQFRVLGWKTDVRPRVDDRGPQGPIDDDLKIEECDIVVGILWKRFGTPIPEMGGETGTEHEIRSAIAASRKSGKPCKPEVVICFNDAPYRPKDVAESKQATRVLEFREEIRGLELAYDGVDDFRDKIRDYLEKYLKAHHPVTPGKAPSAGAGDPTRYLKALREETSHFDVQGLKFGDNRAYRFPIEEFYIPLTTSSSAGAEKPGEMRAAPIPLQEAMLAHRKLLVVGDPGSGKSTFLKRVAFHLCKDWTEIAPLPVRIEAAVIGFDERSARSTSGSLRLSPSADHTANFVEEPGSVSVGVEGQEPYVFRQAKENAKGIDAISGGFQGVRFVTAEAGLRKRRDQIEGLGVNAVTESETVSARHSGGLRHQP
jgi:hypothetical protein